MIQSTKDYIFARLNNCRDGEAVARSGMKSRPGPAVWKMLGAVRSWLSDLRYMKENDVCVVAQVKVFSDEQSQLTARIKRDRERLKELNLSMRALDLALEYREQHANDSSKEQGVE